MKSHNRLVQILKALGDKRRGSFLRYVPLRYSATPIDAIGSLTFDDLVGCFGSPCEWGTDLQQRCALTHWLWSGRARLLERYKFV